MINERSSANSEQIGMEADSERMRLSIWKILVCAGVGTVLVLGLIGCDGDIKRIKGNRATATAEFNLTPTATLAMGRGGDPDTKVFIFNGPTATLIPPPTLDVCDPLKRRQTDCLPKKKK